MRLSKVSVETDASSVYLVGEIERLRPFGRSEVYFKFPLSACEFVRPSADAFAAAMLVPAMKAGENLEIVPALSPKLCVGLRRVRDVFHSWYPELPAIDIVTRSRAYMPEASAPRAASFFSGGVDSFFTLIKRRLHEPLPVPLTHIIFMKGIETELERIRGIEESQRAAETVAAALGVECIVGESNIRSIFPMNWDAHYCGSGLAATALALSGGFSYACIPSGHSYLATVAAQGSTPVVDERFSTEQLQILYDGAETTRPHKVAAIVKWERELVVNHLRVCTRNRGGAYNCGRCAKCVRTAVVLQAIGAFEDSRLFVDKSRRHWERAALTDKLDALRENFAFVRALGSDSQMTALLERVVRRRDNVAALRTLFLNSPLRHLLSIAPRSLRRLLTGAAVEAAAPKVAPAALIPPIMPARSQL
jgi:hypothetical protein